MSRVNNEERKRKQNIRKKYDGGKCKKGKSNNKVLK